MGMFDGDLSQVEGLVEEGSPDQGHEPDEDDEGYDQGPDDEAGDPNLDDEGYEDDSDEDDESESDQGKSGTYQKRYADLQKAYGRQGQKMGEEIATLKSELIQTQEVMKALLPAILQGQQGGQGSQQPQGLLDEIDEEAFLETFAENPKAAMVKALEINNRKQAAAIAQVLEQVLAPVQSVVAERETDTRIANEIRQLERQPDYQEMRPVMLNLLQTVPALQTLPSTPGGMVKLYESARAMVQAGVVSPSRRVPGPAERKRGLRPAGGMGRLPQSGNMDNADDVIRARVTGRIGGERKRGLFS